MLVVLVPYCTLLDGESLIHIDFFLICLFCVIHVWHLRFPFNGIKKYLTLTTERVSTWVVVVVVAVQPDCPPMLVCVPQV